MRPRRSTNTVRLGHLKIGSEHPITIQSMCNTKTTDINSTVAQIIDLQNEGCEIVRVAVPDIDSAHAITQIKKEINIPLIADVHFDYLLAIEAIVSGADGLRINPGNIGSVDKVKKVVDYARDFQIPIRIGVNSGSIAPHILQKYGVSAPGIVESALEHVHILEDLDFDQIKISVKASSVPLTIDAYKLLAEKTNYPLHLGVTEAGSFTSGTIKSAIGIGSLLTDGIGDTIRVSLSADPVTEVTVAKGILKALGLRKGLNIISCPTCARTNIPLIDLVHDVENSLKPYEHLDLTIAVMGCVVNGPGEARHADYGITGGKGEGIIFKRGEIVKKVPYERLLPELLQLVETE